MDPIMVSAGITALGGMIGGSQQNAANAREARKNREFQERMSSTAYQRTTQDMLKAGLNPALAYQQGGASSPGGATSAPQQNTLGNATNSAVAAAQNAANIAATRAQVEKTMSETEQIRLATRITEATSGPNIALAHTQSVIEAVKRQMMENPRYLPAMLNQLEAQLDATRAQARQGRAEADVKELFSRPLIKKGYEAIKGRIAPMFKGSAWQQYMQQKSASPFRGHGGGTSW